MTNFSNDKTYAFFQTPNNKKLFADLENAGAKFFLFPPLETGIISLDENSVNNIKNLSQFDWIIFPDVFAVDYFLQNLEENSVDFYELDDLRVCAFGEAVSDRLRFSQIHADVIPNSIETEIVFKAIVEYIGVNDLEELKFLFPKENSLTYELTDKLESAGAKVFKMPIYKINSSENKEITKLKVLLAGGAIDEFVFSSAEDVFALFFYFSGEIENFSNEAKTSAVGEAAFQTLKEYGFKPRLFHLLREN